MQPKLQKNSSFSAYQTFSPVKRKDSIVSVASVSTRVSRKDLWNVDLATLSSLIEAKGSRGSLCFSPDKVSRNGGLHKRNNTQVLHTEPELSMIHEISWCYMVTKTGRMQKYQFELSMSELVVKTRTSNKVKARVYLSQLHARRLRKQPRSDLDWNDINEQSSSP